jgi:AAA ATPase domain
VLRPTASTSRFEALHPSRMTTLVGREDEYELLLRRWLKAEQGEGQTVLLSGEAGVGKSRLTVAFSERLKGERYLRIRCFCSPQHTNSALHPIIDHSNTPPPLRVTIRWKRNSTNSIRSYDSPGLRPRTRRSSSRCSRRRTMDAIPRSRSPRGYGGKERWTRLSGKWKSCPAPARCW